MDPFANTLHEDLSVHFDYGDYAPGLPEGGDFFRGIAIALGIELIASFAFVVGWLCFR